MPNAHLTDQCNLMLLCVSVTPPTPDPFENPLQNIFYLLALKTQTYECQAIT